MSDKFWLKPLQQLSHEEWELLCDGCGLCCLHKLIDDDTDELLYTQVVCKQYSQHQQRCRDYDNRASLVPDCVQISLSNTEAFDWLPPSCAYRLRYEDKPLPKWHPLLNQGRRGKMLKQATVVDGWAIKEGPEIDPADYIIVLPA